MISMDELSRRPIRNIIDTKWVSKVGKYVVKLGFDQEKALEVWMTERQLSQLERQFLKTPHGYSTDKISVYGLWRGKFYAYAITEISKFEPPTPIDLHDLYEDEPNESI